MHESLLEKSVNGLHNGVGPLCVGFLNTDYVGIEVAHGLHGTAPL